LEARGQTALLAQLQTTQARYMGNTDAILEAFLRLNPPQDLGADPSALDFGICMLDARPRLMVALRRRSPGYIHGRLHSKEPWLTLSSPTIVVKPYEPDATFAVGVDLAQLATSDAQRDYSSVVVIDTNHGSLRLPVRITVSNPPRARLQPAVLQLGKVEALRRSGGNVAIVNEGGGVIAGAVRRAALADG
jgi:hypothetical protein